MDPALESKNLKVTVLMPVFNAQAYLKEAIESILQQTFTDFEFLIINDGSTDQSSIIVESYNDVRIRHVILNKNMGIVNALNTGIRLSNGEYIVRMDADDISLPGRIAEQVEYMDKYPLVGVCGTLVKIIDGKPMNYFMEPSRLEAFLLLDCPLVHPSVIIRKSVLDQHQLFYDFDYIHVEDYKLWVDISKYSKLAMLPLVLLEYRISDTQISTKYTTLQDMNGNKVKQELFEILLSRPLSQMENYFIARKLEKVSLHMGQLINFCNEVLTKNTRYIQSDLEIILSKLFIRNMYSAQFKLPDVFSILSARFLNIRHKLSVLKYGISHLHNL